MDEEFLSIPLDTTDPKDIELMEQFLRKKYEKILREKAENSSKDEKDSA